MLGYKEMQKQTDNELLKMKEACELLKVHPNTLRQWDKKGVLKAVRIGVRGDRRYRRGDIERLIHTT
jgi:excisionase family DNA binding protein